MASHVSVSESETQTTPASVDELADTGGDAVGGGEDVVRPISGRHSLSYTDDKAKILTRLRRIEGQVRGVARMVEDDKYCIDILTQISAIVASSRSVGLLLLEDHIRGCVVTASPDEREATLEELNRAIERFTRSVGN